MPGLSYLTPNVSGLLDNDAGNPIAFWGEGGVSVNLPSLTLPFFSCDDVGMRDLVESSKSSSKMTSKNGTLIVISIYSMDINTTY